ncbi:MAG: TIGR02186 family protein, partial [Desulfofustis sp.]
LGLGIKQLGKRMTATGSVDVPPDIFTMFAEMKGSEGLYQEIPGAVQYTDGRGNLRHFSAVCHIPALITSGSYDITAMIMPANGENRRESARFSVIETGFVKLVDDLSSNRRVLYGVTAVVVALVAGIVMGVLFRQSGGSH